MSHIGDNDKEVRSSLQQRKNLLSKISLIGSKRHALHERLGDSDKADIDLIKRVLEDLVKEVFK